MSFMRVAYFAPGRRILIRGRFLSTSSPSASDAGADQKGQVLSSYKHLRRTCQKVFNEDVTMLSASLKKVKDEYKSNKDVDEKEKITELIDLSKSVAVTLKSMIVQGKLNEDTGRYVFNVTEDTALEDNMPFLGEGNYKSPKRSRKNKSETKCCQDS